MSRMKGILDKLNDTESKVGKTIKGVKDGTVIAQKLAGHYNSIAKWCGLPQVLMWSNINRHLVKSVDTITLLKIRGKNETQKTKKLYQAIQA